MKKLLLPISICLFATASFAGEYKKVDVEDFKGVSFEGMMNVELTQGEENKLFIEELKSGDPQYKMNIKNGVLSIMSDKPKSKQKLNIQLTVKELSFLESEGAININCTNILKGERLDVEIESVGATNLMLDYQTLELDHEAIGSIILSGKVQNMELDVEGVGELDAYELVCQNAKVDISGIGSAKVNVQEKLDADISGIGSFDYKGSPRVKNINRSGIGSVNSDNMSDKTDTTKFSLGDKDVIIINNESDEKKKKVDEDDFKHWDGPMMGINGFINAKGSTSAPAGYNFLELDYSKSFSFQLNLFQKNIHLAKNYLNLLTGLGLEFNSYALNNNYILNPNNGFEYLNSTTGQFVADQLTAQFDSSVAYSKNKLRAAYIQVPLLLEVHTSADPKKAFHIAGGATVGYRFASRTKQVYENGGDKYKRVIKDDFYLSPLKVSATAMIGYSDFTLFANYGLTELFAAGKGPKVYPFSVGLSLDF